MCVCYFQVIWAEQQIAKRRHKRDIHIEPTDPKFPQQWYLVCIKLLYVFILWLYIELLNAIRLKCFYSGKESALDLWAFTFSLILSCSKSPMSVLKYINSILCAYSLKMTWHRNRFFFTWLWNVSPLIANDTSVHVILKDRNAFLNFSSQYRNFLSLWNNISDLTKATGWIWLARTAKEFKRGPFQLPLVSSVTSYIKVNRMLSLRWLWGVLK